MTDEVTWKDSKHSSRSNRRYISEATMSDDQEVAAAAVAMAEMGRGLDAA